MVPPKITRKKPLFLASILLVFLYMIAVMSAALGLMLLGIHLIYGSSHLLAYHALLFVIFYTIVIALVALRSTDSFWPAMAEANFVILGYAAFFFIATLLRARLVQHIGHFSLRDGVVMLTCLGILAAVIYRAKRYRQS